MPRPVVNLPLQGAEPQLTPTSRPQQIQIGATPPPSRSPLMELGQAFREFNPALHGLLQTAAVQADNDAMAKGELAAVQAKAATRLGELDTIIKQGVDSGAIPHVRAPAFERGFRSRVGSELAQASFQEALLSQLPNVTRVQGVVDAEGKPLTHQQVVEKTVADAYSKFSGQLHAEDIYAKTAFDHTAQGVISAFRQRAAEGYTAAYKAAGEQAMADDNSERVLNLATAPHEDRQFFLDNAKAGLDQLRAELPKDKVNQFYLQNVVSPAVAKLIGQRKFTEARNVIDEMGQMDVTGNGGLLGQTAAGKSILTDLQSKVDREKRINGEEEWSALHRERDVKKMAGEDAAGKALQELRLNNGGQLPQDKRWEMVDAFTKANADDPIAARAFADTVNREFENEQKYRSNPKVASDIAVKIKSLRKEDIALRRAEVEAAYNLNSISPSERTAFVQELNKLDALYGAYDEADINRFKKDLYANRGVGGQNDLINFGDGVGGGGSPKDPNSTGKLWDRLPVELKVQHEKLVTAFFQKAVEDDLVNRVQDPLKVPAEKANTFDSATTKARAYALSLLRDLSGVKAKQDTAKEVQKQATAIQQAASRPVPSIALDYTVPTGKTIAGPNAAPGDAPVKETKRVNYTIPADGVADAKAYKADVALPKADRDFGEVMLPGAMRPQPVSLVRLAGDFMGAKLPPEAQAKAKEIYAVAKSRNGFTPEEITSAETKHGVPFNPAEIDPRRIAVFRSVAELNKHWNDGKLDETFIAVGDAVDPKDTLTTRDFYFAQRALLTR